MASLHKYMAQYDHEHTNALNKVLHGIGISMILAGIVLTILTFWRIGLALFVGGWAALFLGHRIEGNKPAFFQGAIYFLVGPIWVAKEIKSALLRKSHSSEELATEGIVPGALKVEKKSVECGTEFSSDGNGQQER
jgi:hypothetical protein